MIGVTFIATTATVFTISALMVNRTGAQAHNDARVGLEEVLQRVGMAETAQRNYLLTGDSSLLAPYNTAIAGISKQLPSIVSSNTGASQQAGRANLKSLVEKKLAELNQGVALRQAGDAAGAAETIRSGASQSLDKQLAALTSQVQSAESAQITRDRNSITNLAALARDISIVSMLATLGLTVLVYWLYLKAIQSERRLDRAKDEFVSLASHQLRTPATGIKSILSMLVAEDFGPLNERQTHFMRRAIQSNERELNIIEELLNVAKVDAGRLILHATEFNIDELVVSIAGEQRAAIAAKRQELIVRRPKHPLPVVADEEKLYMAIGNLLDNARKYTPNSGKIALTVGSHHGAVHIDVTDSGVGIEAAEIKNIFDRFHRASDAMNGNVEGAGLGLYLASRIAELHGGAIEVTSRLGKGTKFVMILPQGDRRVAENSAR